MVRTPMYTHVHLNMQDVPVYIGALPYGVQRMIVLDYMV
jgi:hypothetical protein